jgi:hypothetical protein
MSTVDQLIDYIKSLTPEQADRTAKYLPVLIADSTSEKEEYISTIIQTLILTEDIALLDLILQLLQKSRKS